MCRYVDHPTVWEKSWEGSVDELWCGCPMPKPAKKLMWPRLECGSLTQNSRLVSETKCNVSKKKRKLKIDKWEERIQKILPEAEGTPVAPTQSKMDMTQETASLLRWWLRVLRWASSSYQSHFSPKYVVRCPAPFVPKACWLLLERSRKRKWWWLFDKEEQLELLSEKRMLSFEDFSRKI